MEFIKRTSLMDLRIKELEKTPIEERFDIMVEIGADFSLLQESKLAQIDILCDKDIMKGFRSETTGYFYSFNIYDQSNFSQQAIELINNPKIDTVMWKTEDGGPLPHTREEFLEICNEAGEHKTKLMTRFWEIKARIQKATTVEELAAIEWT